MLRLPEQWPGLPEILQAEDIANFLKFSLLFIFVLSLSGLAGALFSQEPGWNTVFWNSLALTAASGAAIWLLQRKKVLPAVYLAVIGNGVWLALAAWMGAGVNGITYAALILPILTAALFLGRQAGFLAALASAGYGLFLLTAGRMGWLVNIERPISDVFAWLAHTALFFVSAQLISISLWQVERALKKARAEIEERAQTESEIRRLNAELEERIAERTAQLAESEERYRLISTVSSDYVFSSRVNEDGSLVLDWVAGAFEKMTGYSREEYVERGGWSAALHPDDSGIDQRDMESIRKNQPVITEVRTFTKQGELRWERVYAHPRWDERENRLIGVYGAVQDITERKQTEQALRASENRFRTLVEQLPVITYMDRVDPFGNDLYVSPQFEQLTGYNPEEGLRGEYDFWFNHVHPEDRAQMTEEYRRCLENGEPLKSEYRFLARDGRFVWFQDRAVRLDDANGQPEYILGVITDITERKQAEQRLERQANQLAMLYQLGQRMAASRGLEEIYRATQQTVEQLMPTDAFYIALLDESQNTIEYVYLTDQGVRYPDESIPISEQTITARVITTGEPLVFTTDAGWEAFHINRSLYGTQEESRSVLIAPLKLSGKVIGAISAQSYQPDTYTGEQIQVFMTLANQVATAIGNSRLVQSLRLQAAALDAAANAIIISDADGIIQWVNPAFTAMTGYSSHEAIGKKTSLLRSGLQEQAFYEELWNTLAEGRVWQGELVNRRKDGSLYVEEQVITPVRDEQGKVFRYISIRQDITSRKQAEEREIRRRAMMKTVIDLGKAVTKITDLRQCLHEIHRSVQVGLGFDRVGLFDYDPVQKQVRGLIGTSAAGELEDTSWFSEPVEAYEGWIKAVSETRGLHLVENYSAAYDLASHEHMRGVEQHATLAGWVGEKPVLLIGVDNLVTGRKFSPEQLEALELFAGYAGLAIENAQWNAQLEQRVAERTQQLQAANQELESLAYTIAHDLRIPVRAMLGFASILKETEAGNLSLASLQRLDRIRDSAKLMGQQVDELLEFMRMGRAALRSQPVDMTGLVRAVRESLETEMEGRDIRMRVQDLPACQGDRSLLRRVWLNLLANAIKFTRSRPLAEIEIGARQAEGVTEYFIRDNGVGFDMKFVDNLFGAFQRLHHPDEYEGTGMGLAIVQRILQRHGGSIRAEAEEGKGAAFYFTLEAKQPSPPA
jgi:PAS domain S-box-containing protein